MRQVLVEQTAGSRPLNVAVGLTCVKITSEKTAPANDILRTLPALFRGIRSAPIDHAPLTHTGQNVRASGSCAPDVCDLSGSSIPFARFTATVNAELRVGDVAETITVSGSSPVVDVQNVVTQRVMTRDVIDSIPTGKLFVNVAVLIPVSRSPVRGAPRMSADRAARKTRVLRSTADVATSR
jgi:hypothetical protein